MGSNMVFLGVTIIMVISAGGFNTLAVLFCLIFAIGLVQAVSACVAAGFGCSVVCCNTNTVEVVVITPSGPMTSIGQIAWLIEMHPTTPASIHIWICTFKWKLINICIENTLNFLLKKV